MKWLAPVACLSIALISGCRPGDDRFYPVSMWNDSRIKPLEQSPMPGIQSSARPLPAGVVPRGALLRDDPIGTYRTNGKLVTQIPFEVTRKVLERGQERYNIYCAPCHGRAGNGEGLVVQRGFPPPPDYAIPRLRRAPIGHFYEVITYGYGIMYPYASRVPPNDRWAIAAYIRVLQAARPVVPEDVTEAERIRARERSGVTVPAPGEPLNGRTRSPGGGPALPGAGAGGGSAAPGTGGGSAAPGAGGASVGGVQPGGTVPNPRPFPGREGEPAPGR